MRRLLIILVFAIMATPTFAAQNWAIYEKASPVDSWSSLKYKYKNEAEALDVVSGRCGSTISIARKPKAMLKVVAPTGEEQVFVCSEVRAANGRPDTETPLKPGQVKLW